MDKLKTGGFLEKSKNKVVIGGVEYIGGEETNFWISTRILGKENLDEDQSRAEILKLYGNKILSKYFISYKQIYEFIIAKSHIFNKLRLQYELLKKYVLMICSYINNIDHKKLCSYKFVSIPDINVDETLSSINDPNMLTDYFNEIILFLNDIRIGDNKPKIALEYVKFPANFNIPFWYANEKMIVRNGYKQYLTDLLNAEYEICGFIKNIEEYYDYLINYSNNIIDHCKRYLL